MPHTEPPTRAELLAWLQVTDPGTPGDDYDLALADALAQQTARCVIDPYSEGLHHAALRRAAKILAGKGMSLGVFDSGDYGAQFLPRWDQLIEDSEADYRKLPGV